MLKNQNRNEESKGYRNVEGRPACPLIVREEHVGMLALAPDSMR
jgi:hypothetical protein